MDQASDAVRVLVRIRPSTCEQDPVLNWDANDGTIQIEERQVQLTDSSIRERRI